MALDPLSALSIAGCIVQFVDFSTKVLSRTDRLYKSARGALDSQEDLEFVTSDLQQILKQVQRSMPSERSQSAPEGDTSLQKLCKACSDIAEELLTRLNQLKVSGEHRKQRAWQSFHHALVSVWSEEEMKLLVQRLSSVREQIQIHVILGLRDQLDSFSLQKWDRFDKLDNVTQGILTALLEVRSDVTENIAELKDSIQDQRLAIAQLLGRVDCLAVRQNFAITAISGGSELEGSRPMQGCEVTTITERNDYFSILDSLEETKIRSKAAEGILRELWFPTITSREEQISEAHKATFQWIFERAPNSDRPWDSFVDWLKDGSGIYWVNGKAASGKSTLMRYLYDDSRTRKLLSAWAKPHPLTTASFFFWNSGAPEQRSQTGLIQSVLFECLTQNPDLVPIVFPSIWARKYSDLVMPFDDSPWITDWDQVQTRAELFQSYVKSAAKFAKPASWAWIHQRKPESTASQPNRSNSLGSQTVTTKSWPLTSLMDAFTKMIKQDIVPLKICLFVDGLDEYDGDHSTIASLFQQISSSHNVKVCVASRPLLPFDDAFTSSPSLRLQDLTQQDIKLWVASSLNDNYYFQKFAQEDLAQAHSLIRDIVSKADGVFLWVTLVVKSLLEGLGNRDDISDLQRRIDLLPPDLETLFNSMVAKISPFYLERTSQLFQIKRSSREYINDIGPTEHKAVTLDLITLSLAADPDDNQAIAAEFKDISEEEIAKRCRRMEDRLKVQSMGLLEAVKTGCGEAHRGSKFCGEVQYLHRTVRDYLESPKIWSTLLQRTNGSDFNPNASLLRAFVWRLKYNIELSRGTEPVAIAAIIHAHHADSETQRSHSSLLAQLHQAREYYWALYLSMETYHKDFIALAVQYALCSYINEIMDHNSVRLKYDLYSPLEWALIVDQTNERLPLSLRMVTILLQVGADPNERSEGNATIWELVLRRTWDLSRTANLSNIGMSKLFTYTKIFRLLLEYGAYVKVMIRIGHPSQMKTARYVVQETFGDLYPNEAAMLDDMFEVREAKLKKAPFYQKLKRGKQITKHI